MAFKSAAQQRTEFDGAVFSPVPIFAALAPSIKAGVPAISRRDEQQVRIGGKRRIPERRKGKKGIILRLDDQRRKANARDELQRTGLRVVIKRVAETETGCRDHVIEVPQAAHAVERLQAVKLREELLLAPQRSSEASQEGRFIEPIFPAANRFRAETQINRRADRTHAAQLWRHVVFKLTRELE